MGQRTNRTIALLGLLLGGLHLIFSCNSKVSVKTMQYLANGQKLYQTHCQNCHGKGGEGLGLLYPPLTDTSYLRSQRRQLPCIIKNGLSEKIIVHGQTYDETMPANSQLTESDIAYILTYVTVQFGDSKEDFSTEEVRESLNSCQ